MRQARGEEPAARPPRRVLLHTLDWPSSIRDAKDRKGLRLRQRRMSLLTDSSSRRSEQDHQAARQLELEYREHADTLDRYLNATFGTALSTAEREETRQQAFVGLATEYAKGVEIESTEAMLITCARNAAYSLLRSADRRRRKPFDPQDSAEARLPDTAAPVDVAIVEADENRRVKMLMEQLDERSRTVLQLRLELELDAPEIAERLGVSPSHAYKLLKQAGRALADSITANDQGAHSRQQRALLAACEVGTATAEQRRQAELLRDDPHARVLLAEIRGLGHRAAAFMPPVAVAGAAPPSSGRISHMLSSVKQYVTDLASRGTPAQEAATQVATSAGLRGATPATIAVMCGAGLLGGGTTAVVVNECVQAGGPAALVDNLQGGGDSDDAAQPDEEQILPLDQPPIVVETAPVTSPDPPVEATPRPDVPQSSSQPTPTPATGGGSVSGLSGNPAPQAAPAPPPPPTSSGAAAAGGTGGSGDAGTAFGGGL